MSIKQARLIVNAPKHNLLNSVCNNAYVCIYYMFIFMYVYIDFDVKSKTAIFYNPHTKCQLCPNQTLKESV